jgi:aminopeptidase N
MRRLPLLGGTLLLLSACSLVPSPRPDAASPPPATPPSFPASVGPVESTGPGVGSPGLGDPYYATYGNGGYDVATYDLSVRFTPSSGALTGIATIGSTAKFDLRRFDLDLHGLTVNKITVGGQAATFTRDGDELVVTPASAVKGGSSFTTIIEYAGTPGDVDASNLGDAGFKKAHGVTFVAGEPESASSWFPVNDHPSDKALYAIAITVPDGEGVISNGVLAGKDAKDGWTTWRWNVTSPMASYLVTFAVGALRVEESTHKGKQVRIAVADTIAATSVASVEETTEICDYFEQFFGPYPFDAYGAIVVDDPDLGFSLETQTRPTYAASMVRGGDPRGVVAHELAHQWFGDSVSVAQWRDIWLNEGFATYAQWLWTEHTGGPTMDQEFDRQYTNTLNPIWTVPPGNPTEPRLFHQSVYNRGAMTLYALRKTVGDDTFYKILKTWTAQRKDRNASTEDFVKLSEQVSGKQLRTLFADWLYGTTRPAHP